MPLGYVILSKVLPCPLPSCFMLQTHNVASSGGTTRKSLALGREIVYNIQSL